MKEMWKLPMTVRYSANGPSQGDTVLCVDPDKILAMIKHPETGYASLLMPQGTIDTTVAFDKLWDSMASLATRVTFEGDKPDAPDPRGTVSPQPQQNPPLDSLHPHHHHP